jgi:polar amino acid transport system permease protein
LSRAARNALPDLVSNTIQVVKLTSIASVFSFPELLYPADMARSPTLDPGRSGGCDFYGYLVAARAPG